MKVRSITKLLGTIGMLLMGMGAKSQPDIPVSPEAAALTKMVNYPVSFNTGIPSISLPLYQIESGGLSLPIALNYHAGGFKIHEKSTSVGLGWTLSSDIQITRTVNGLDDFAAGGYIANEKIKHFSPTDALLNYPLYTFAGVFVRDAYMMANGELDGMPDKFNYKLLNKSGSFYFRKNANNNSYVIVPVPYDNLKITFNNGQFTIVDTDGTTYLFGGQFSTTVANLATDFSELTSNSSADYVRTAFKCSKIYNANRTETIDFTYQLKSPVAYRTNRQSIEFYSSDNPCNVPNYITGDRLVADYPSMTTYEQLAALYPMFRLSSPKYVENFANSKSTFHLPYLDANNNVVDLSYVKTVANTISSVVYGIALTRIDFSQGSVVFTGTDEIDAIQVKNQYDEEIKTFNLFHSYVVPNSSLGQPPAVQAQFTTRYLDSVQVRNGNTAYETYKLLYKNKTGFGDYLMGKDAWGYRNVFTTEISDSYDYTGVSINHIKQRYYKNLDNGCANYVDSVDFVIGNGNSLSRNTEATDESPTQAGMLKRIVYPTGGYVDFEYESNRVRQDVSSRLELLAMTGGVRIKSIAHYDGISLTPASYKYYRYGDTEDGTGLLINSPFKAYDVANRTFRPYSYVQNVFYGTGATGGTACTNRSCVHITHQEKKTTYLPASSADYTYPHGAPIYYTKVSEYNQDLGKQTGKKVYTYYSIEKFSPYSFIIDAKVPGTNINVLQTDGLMGKERSVEDYQFSNGKYALVHSKEYTYSKYSKPEQVRVIYSYQNNSYSLYSGSSGDLYNYNSSFASGPGGNIYEDFNAGQYGIQVAKLLLATEKEKWVSGVDTTFKTTSYEYNNATYPQVSKITTDGANGSVSKTFKYAYDFPGIAVYNQMLALNRISTVLEEVSSVYNSNGAVETARTKTNYGAINNSAYCYVPLSIQKSVGGQPLVTEVSFDLYDAKANLLQLTEKNKLVKSFVWGYNQTYPVAEIIGASYPGHLSSVTTIAGSSVQSTILTATNDIRSQLPYAMVKSFTYRPLIGVSSITEANGASKYFEYEPYGRLSIVKNDSLHIVNRYNYHLNKTPLNFAGTLLSPNDPIMLTYNKIGSDNVRRTTNAIQPGATYHQPLSSVDANVYAASYLNSNWYSIAGDLDQTRPEASSKMLINMWPGNSIVPRKVYLDLIKDGHIVVSKEIPLNTPPFNFDELYVEPGAYKVSIRFEDNYNGSLNWLQVNSSLGVVRVKTGDNFTFQAGVEYMFILFND